MSFSVEKNDKKDILRIHQEGHIYTFGYYSTNVWMDDNKLILKKAKTNKADEKIFESEFVLIDINEKTEKVLHKQIYKEGRTILPYTDFTVFDKNLYFSDDDNVLWSLNIDTLEKKAIFKDDYRYLLFHITKDGRYINWQSQRENKLDTCMRLDLHNNEVIKAFEKQFAPPFICADHMMICPTNPELFFFAHEGDTQYITNRLWIAEIGKEPYNIAKQRLDENGNLIDCFGHESWSADGKGIYFVKYACSPEPPRGIGYVDLETKEHQILYSKYNYWHVNASHNGKYLAADLLPEIKYENGLEKSAVCLIDMENNTETIIADVHSMKHPAHPHPQFNPSCARICFHDVMDNGDLSVGIVEI